MFFIILIKFDNYNISLFNCKDNNKEEKISLNKFEESQKIDLTKILGLEKLLFYNFLQFFF